MRLTQSIFSHAPHNAVLQTYTATQVADAASVIRRLNPKVLSVAIQLDINGCVDSIALATVDRVFQLVLSGVTSEFQRRLQISSLQAISSNRTFVGFDMAHIIILLSFNYDLRFQGVELATLGLRYSLQHFTESPVEYLSRMSSAPTRDVHDLWAGTAAADLKVCYQAWLTSIASMDRHAEILRNDKLHLSMLTQEEIDTLGIYVTGVCLLEEAAPNLEEKEFIAVEGAGDSSVMTHNFRYQTRVRKSKTATVEMTMDDGQKNRTTVEVEGNFSSVVNMERIRVVGRQELTLADQAREHFLRRILLGTAVLQAAPFIRTIWFPQAADAPKSADHGLVDMGNCLYDCPQLAALNASQRDVVNAMLSDKKEASLIVVHGSPGTGKTTTIAHATLLWQTFDQPVWITAQKNVGVKNIAEALLKRNVDFKIFVSAEYYVEWHEDQYSQPLKQRLVRVDELSDKSRPIKSILGGALTFLCPMSLFSNPVMHERVFRVAPVRTLIIDEASQIHVYDYMPLFHSLRTDLSKVCFFGDPRQRTKQFRCMFYNLAYGVAWPQFLLTDKSLHFWLRFLTFEHLQNASYFLNTQYRLPTYLGDFISDEVYDSKLISEHSVTGKDCIAFIDVGHGDEERVGTSWNNTAEVEMIVYLVKAHYDNKEYAIITPYDPQRAAIEKALQKAGLRHDNVFTVDSFQGQESDYILVSTVRTTKPGFLTSVNRTNVLLTRCKLGMVIVTNHEFLRGSTSGSQTLVGKLAAHWTANGGLWISGRDVLELRAIFPAPGAHHPIPPPLSASAATGPQTVVCRDDGDVNRVKCPEPASDFQALSWSMVAKNVDQPVPKPHEFPSLVDSDEAFPASSLQGRWASAPDATYRPDFPPVATDWPWATIQDGLSPSSTSSIPEIDFSDPDWWKSEEDNTGPS